MTQFSDFNLHPFINESIEKLGFKEATKIQEKSIPLIQGGDDVAGLAQTGTGKTAAFLIPILQRLYVTQKKDETYTSDQVKAFDDWGPRSVVLVLVPTRELADQVASNLDDLSQGQVSYATVYGGVAYEKQKEALKEGVQFVIATPGRLIDLYKEKCFDPALVRCVVFDEADRMFDMGFKEDMCYLLDRIPRDRQFLVYSATLNFDVLAVAYEFGSNPVEIEIDRELPKTDQVKDEILHVGHQEKPKFLLSLLKEKKYEQAVVFSNFVRTVPKIEKFLQDNGIKAVGISSALSQGHRNKVIESFRNGATHVLVATDVAARGLDIENIDLVINYELPDDSENYVHRIGRTGRAGREGTAFSIVSERDVEALKRLESFLGTKLVIGWLDEEQITEDFKPFPYQYDPRGKVKDFRSGKDKKPFKKPGRPSGYSDKRGERPRRNKEDFKKPGQKSSKFKAKSSKLKANSVEKKRTNRYDKFKTRSRNQKTSFWQKVKGWFVG